jgi:Phage major capsid protein E
MAMWQLDEFQGPQFLGFVRNVPPPQEFALGGFLPDRTINDLSFEYIVGAFQRPIMANIIGWDAEAPIHGRRAAGEKIQGELPPIKRKARIDEKELIRFYQPRAQSADVQQAINAVYDLTEQLLDSVQARVEWLRGQVLTKDTVLFNEDGVILTLDYGIPTTPNQATCGVTAGYGAVWSNTATANPVADLMKFCTDMQATYGFRPRRAGMSAKTLGYLYQNVAIRDLVRGTGAPTTILSRAELDAVFVAYDLPSIQTYDVLVAQEAADGSLTEVRTTLENVVWTLPGDGAQVGNVLWGPSAEATRRLLGTPLATRAPGIYAHTYGEEEPPAEWVKAVGVALPSVPGANLIGQITAW